MRNNKDSKNPESDSERIRGRPSGLLQNLKQKMLCIFFTDFHLSVMGLVYCIHHHAETGGSARVAMSMMILTDIVKSKRSTNLPASFKCRMVLPSLIKSISLWELPVEGQGMAELKEWLDSGVLGEPGLINELSEADEQMSFGLTHLAAVRAAERVVSTSTLAANTLASHTKSTIDSLKSGSVSFLSMSKKGWGALLSEFPDNPFSNVPPSPSPIAQQVSSHSISGTSPGMSRDPSSTSSRGGLSLPLSVNQSVSVEGLKKLVSPGGNDREDDDDDGSLGFNKMKVSDRTAGQGRTAADNAEIEELI